MVCERKIPGKERTFRLLNDASLAFEASVGRNQGANYELGMGVSARHAAIYFRTGAVDSRTTNRVGRIRSVGVETSPMPPNSTSTAARPMPS